MIAVIADIAVIAEIGKPISTTEAPETRRAAKIGKGKTEKALPMINAAWIQQSLGYLWDAFM